MDLTMDAVDTATYHVKTREGTHSMTVIVSATIIPNPSDVLAQVFGKNIEKNPDNWSDPRLDELIVAQEIELDTDKRAAIFSEMVEILRKREELRTPQLAKTGWCHGLPHPELCCTDDHSAGEQV